MSNQSSRVAWSGPFLVAFGAMLWGADGVLRVPLTRSLSAPAIVLDEHLLLALYAVPALLLSVAALRKLRATEWLALVGISWGGSALATVLFTMAFSTGNPTTVILLQKVQPLFAIVLARVLLGEPLGRRYWPWLVLAMVGAYLVSFGTITPFWELGQAKAITGALALGAAALWGSATVFGRFVLADLSFPTVTGARFLLALPFLFVLALPDGNVAHAVAGLQDSTVNLVLLALIPGLISLLVYYRGLTTTRASIATVAELAFPATAIVLNWFFLHQGVTTLEMVGFVMVWCAIAAMDRVVAPSPEPARATATAGA